MARALQALPAGHLATEGEVGFAIRSLLRQELALLRAKLGLLARAASSREHDDVTTVFRPEDCGLGNERATTRPPPPGAESNAPPTNLAPSVDQEPQTQLMFVATETAEREPARPGKVVAKRQVSADALPRPAALGAGRRDEMTQIFMPVFANETGQANVGGDQARGRGDSAPVASVALLPDLQAHDAGAYMGVQRAGARVSRGARTDVWAAVSLVLAVVLAVVILFAMAR